MWRLPWTRTLEPSHKDRNYHGFTSIYYLTCRLSGGHNTVYVALLVQGAASYSSIHSTNWLPPNAQPLTPS